MLKKFLLISALSTLLATSAFSSPTFDLETLVNETSVTLEMGCSGEVVGQKHILTAAHCFRGWKKDTVWVSLPNGTLTYAYVKNVDTQTDLALVFVPGAKFDSPLRLAFSEPRLGDDVWCIGNPLGGPQPDTVSKGVISHTKRKSTVTPGERRYQYDCYAHPGSSGGMVLNTRGELISVITEGFVMRMTQVGSSFTYGVTLPTIKAFLKKWITV